MSSSVVAWRLRRPAHVTLQETKAACCVIKRVAKRAQHWGRRKRLPQSDRSRREPHEGRQGRAREGEEGEREESRDEQAPSRMACARGGLRRPPQQSRRTRRGELTGPPRRAPAPGTPEEEGGGGGGKERGKLLLPVACPPAATANSSRKHRATENGKGQPAHARGSRTSEYGTWRQPPEGDGALRKQPR